jgi:exonuclease SbcD
MGLKIVHTSDWHLGKELHNISLQEDMQLFFDWLLEFIAKERVQVLLMSGDLFDQSNPSQQALRHYYQFLKRMVPLNCKLILTGGNHDSPAVVNAPRELLDILDVHVVGGKPANVGELFFEYTDEDQSLVVAAVPYLRDRDIRAAAPGESYDDKIVMTREGLHAYFDEVNEYYEQYFIGKPFILMAHLFAQGAQVSESERDIQVGNLAGVEASIFGSHPQYVALGHIHKPQRVQFPHIRYSGSPIPLSFSEKADDKQIVMLEWDGHHFKQEKIPIPSFRRLKSFEGSLDDVREELEQYTSNSVLTDLGEIIIKEDLFSLKTIEQMEEMLVKGDWGTIRVIKGRVEFEKAQGTLAEVLHQGEQVQQMTPEEIFRKRLELDNDPSDHEELLNAFREIMDELNNPSTSN